MGRRATYPTLTGPADRTRGYPARSGGPTRTFLPLPARPLPSKPTRSTSTAQTSNVSACNRIRHEDIPPDRRPSQPSFWRSWDSASYRNERRQRAAALGVDNLIRLSMPNSERGAACPGRGQQCNLPATKSSYPHPFSFKDFIKILVKTRARDLRFCEAALGVGLVGVFVGDIQLAVWVIYNLIHRGKRG